MMTRLGTLHALILAGVAVFFCGSTEAEPVVEAKKIDGRQVKFTIRGLSGSPLPERVRLRLDGQDLAGAKLAIDPLSVGIFVDNSIGCRLSNMENALARHIEQISRAFPSETRVTVSTFSAAGEKAISNAKIAQKIGRPSLACTDDRSKSVGDLALSLQKSRATYDLLLIYSSGNFYLDETRTGALASVASKKFILSYALRSAELKSTPELTLSIRPEKEPPSQWLSSESAVIASGLPVSASVDFEVPKTLKAGEYRVDLEFIANGSVKSQASVYLPYSPSGGVTKKTPTSLFLILIVLAATLVLESAILIVAYYRTPRCRSCKRAVLRDQKICVSCLRRGDAIVVSKLENSSRIYAVGGVFSLGSDRSFRIRPAELKAPGGFEIRRSGNVYQLTARNSVLRLNQGPVKGSRYLHTGDVLSIGEWSCQFHVKA